MKRFFAIILIICLFLLNICSCNEPEQEPMDVMSSDLEGGGEHASLSAIDLLSEEKTADGTILRYQDQSFSKLPIKESEMDVLSPPESYSELIQKVEEDGLIVAGHATGIRETFPDKVITMTEFVVEKVYYGKCASSTIIVGETFCLQLDDEGYYLLTAGNDYTRLKDDVTTLLYLTPYSSIENVYQPVYYDLPLPEDYQDYDADYREKLFDFYRGEKAAYQYGDPYTVEEEMVNEDGTIDIVEVIYGAVYWPAREISDEALLEEMQENILIRTATEFEIKIWPWRHYEFGQEQLPDDSEGLRILSLPPGELVAY